MERLRLSGRDVETGDEESSLLVSPSNGNTSPSTSSSFASIFKSEGVLVGVACVELGALLKMIDDGSLTSMAAS